MLLLEFFSSGKHKPATTGDLAPCPKDLPHKHKVGSSISCTKEAKNKKKKHEPVIPLSYKNSP